jgi:hypothetical protein
LFSVLTSVAHTHNSRVGGKLFKLWTRLCIDYGKGAWIHTYLETHQAAYITYIQLLNANCTSIKWFQIAFLRVGLQKNI